MVGLLPDQKLGERTFKKEVDMADLLTNKHTGTPHTAKWGTILSGIGGIIVILAACVPKITTLTWPVAIPVAMLLLGITTAGGVAMGNRNKNGG